MNGNVATAMKQYSGQAAGGQGPRESVLAGMSRTAEGLHAGLDELEQRLGPVLSPEGPALTAGTKGDMPPHNELRTVADGFLAAEGRLARLISRIDL